MKEFWNERYCQEEYAYGEEPNQYLKNKLETLPKGRILFVAEGEGRNAVFAARLGWQVEAFDMSQEGQKKAFALAQKNNVSIHYQVLSAEDASYENESFDAIVFIFARFPTLVKTAYHQKISQYLKKGGWVILEAFSKNHLAFQDKNPQVGGPKDIGMLASVEEIQSFFPDYEILELSEEEVYLEEGTCHVGEGSVVRFFGRK